MKEEAKDSCKSKVTDKENKSSMKRIGSILSALKKSPISRSGRCSCVLDFRTIYYFFNL